MASGANNEIVGQLLGYGLLCLIAGGWLYHIKSLWEMRRANIRAAARARPHGYAMPCPLCGSAPMREARKLWDIRGIGVVTHIEPHILAGCTRCVRREGLKRTARVLTHGIWSVGGIIATPVIVFADLAALGGPMDVTFTENVIRRGGVEPHLVRVDADGLTIADRARLYSAACSAAAIIFTSDRAAPKGTAVAQRHLRDAWNGRLSAARLDQLLHEARGKQTPPAERSVAERALLYALIRNVVLADGALTAALRWELSNLVADLGFTDPEVSRLWKEIGFMEPEPARPRYEERRQKEKEKAKSCGNAGAGANGGGAKDHDAGKRRPRRNRDDLDKARVLLGVTPSATYAEIEKAYRTIIAACHPDRAGLDPRLQKIFTAKAQEITWAKEALRRANAMS